jgi:phospholipase/carboxylesterase
VTPTDLLRCVELGATEDADVSVIWLHGLGADGHDFVPIVPELHLDPALRVRFVFPHAPAIPVTINGGMVMPAWYDIAELDLKRRHDDAGILASAQHVEALLSRELERGVAPERTLLVGFSQGGAMALHVGQRHDRTLAGIVALSAYMVRGDTLEAEAHDANARTPVFMGHGSRDPMVPVARGRAAKDQLVGLGREVSWHEYGMQHEVCLEEIRDLSSWMAARWASSTS